ncbi:MAG TPA: hypothetical protein DCZ10_18635 [Pelotomaculum sp.]|nr:hypothetical protein [Pelotomaculum sp.]
MKKFFLLIFLYCFLFLLSGCSYSHKAETRTYPDIVYATIDDKTIWSFCELLDLIDYNGADTQGYPYPITPTSIYLSSSYRLNKEDTMLITELPLVESVAENGREILTRVSKITPANNWIVIEEYLAAKDWNQGHIKLIAINLDNKNQLEIATGGYSGGRHFRYFIKDNYIFWSSQHLDEIFEAAIMNLNTGEKQELHNVKPDSEITISSGLILIDGIPIKLEI